MPITRGAKKAHRSSERKRVFNIRRKETMSRVVKQFQKALEGGEIKTAEEMLPTVYKAVDKAAKRGVIKDNTAARKKSRLTAYVQKVKTAAK